MALQAQLLHIPGRNERLATRRSPFRSARVRCCPHGPSRCPRFTGTSLVSAGRSSAEGDSQGRRAPVLIASSSVCPADVSITHLNRTLRKGWRASVISPLYFRERPVQRPAVRRWSLSVPLAVRVAARRRQRHSAAEKGVSDALRAGARAREGGKLRK